MIQTDYGDARIGVFQVTQAWSDTLLDVYDTAVNSGVWRRALDKTDSFVDAKGVALVIRTETYSVYLENQLHMPPKQPNDCLPC